MRMVLDFSKTDSLNGCRLAPEIQSLKVCNKQLIGMRQLRKNYARFIAESRIAAVTTSRPLYTQHVTGITISLNFSYLFAVP